MQESTLLTLPDNFWGRLLRLHVHAHTRARAHTRTRQHHACACAFRPTNSLSPTMNMILCALVRDSYSGCSVCVAVAVAPASVACSPNGGYKMCYGRQKMLFSVRGPTRLPYAATHKHAHPHTGTQNAHQHALAYARTHAHAHTRCFFRHPRTGTSTNAACTLLHPM